MIGDSMISVGNLFQCLTILTQRAALLRPTRTPSVPTYAPGLLHSHHVPLWTAWLHSPDGLTDTGYRTKSRSSLLFPALNKPRPGRMHINTGAIKHWNLLGDIIHHQPFILNALYPFLRNSNFMVNPSPFEKLGNFQLRSKFLHSETETRASLRYLCCHLHSGWLIHGA